MAYTYSSNAQMAQSSPIKLRFSKQIQMAQSSPMVMNPTPPHTVQTTSVHERVSPLEEEETDEREWVQVPGQPKQNQKNIVPDVHGAKERSRPKTWQVMCKNSHVLKFCSSPILNDKSKEVDCKHKNGAICSECKDYIKNSEPQLQQKQWAISKTKRRKQNSQKKYWQCIVPTCTYDLCEPCHKSKKDGDNTYSSRKRKEHSYEPWKNGMIEYQITYDVGDRVKANV